MLLAATQIQGQCPLSSCSLVSQVNICTNGNATGGGAGCADSQLCVMTLRESTTEEECCNKIVDFVLTNSPTGGQSGSICSDQTQFGDTQDVVNSATLRSEIRAGTYIVPQTDPQFIYTDCSGCIKSIQLAVSPTSTIRDGGQEIKFHTFTETTGGSSVYQRRGDVVVWNSSVVSTSTTAVDRKIVEYRPIGLPQLCFNQGDVFGFTIQAGSDVTVSTRLASDGNRFILNVSSTLEITSGCSQLSNLYTSTANFSLAPLIHIVTGDFPPTEPPIATDEQSTTEPITATDGTTASPRTTTPAASNQLPPSNPTDVQPPGGVSPPDSPGHVIYAAGGFAGAICILLIVVIIVVVICIVQRRKHRSYQYGNGFKFGSPIPGADSNNDAVAVTGFSHRMSPLTITDSSPDRDIITIENTLAEQPVESSPAHHYDLPSELISADNIHRMPWTESPRQKNYINMHTAPSSMSVGSMSQLQISKTYDSPSELGTTPLLRHHGGTVKNPLYQETGPQEPTYHNPEELNFHQKKKLGTLGTSFDDDGIYTETETVGNPSTPPTPCSLDNSHYSPPPDEFDNMNTFNPYHELLPGEVVEETGHHYFLIEKDKELESSLQVGSLGRHRVFEPGLYVPDAEERKQMTTGRGENPSSIYEIFEEKHRKLSGKKKKFFKEEDHFWKPDEEEDKIYDQLSEKQYREILRGQIKFEDHLGVGQFGSVSRANWINEEGGKKVAVKTLKPTILASKKVKFLQEAAIMGQFFHSNVIRLFGVVTVGEPVMIVMELMGLGDLSKYLWENYRLNKKPAPQPVTLLSFCRQVACGMKYLAKKKYVHRDLAARNVFVNETLVCKIGDFGMSRHLEENYYMSSGGTVPIKWTAPEGLNYKKFSTASDVYSYGMLLYEIWSLGEKPLANIKITDVAHLVTEGYCQPPPPGCPRKIYETMVKCWNPKYNDRPSFDEIFELLNRTDSDILSWSEEDKTHCSKMAAQIGAPVTEGTNLYQDLQKTYQITLV